jgi:hypothetical protein
VRGTREVEIAAVRPLSPRDSVMLACINKSI